MPRLSSSAKKGFELHAAHVYAWVAHGLSPVVPQIQLHEFEELSFPGDVPKDIVSTGQALKHFIANGRKRFLKIVGAVFQAAVQIRTPAQAVLQIEVLTQ